MEAGCGGTEGPDVSMSQCIVGKDVDRQRGPAVKEWALQAELEK